MKRVIAMQRLEYLRCIANVRRLMSDHRDRLAGSIEQVLASAVSMMGLIVLSRLMSVSDFGILATATGIWLMMEMVQHSLTIGPFVVACPDPEEDREQLGAWLLWNLILSVTATALFFGIGFYLRPILPQLAQGLIIAAPLTASGMIYMFARRIHYHRRDRVALLSQTLLYGLSYFIALVLVAPTVALLTPGWGAVIMTVAYAVPGCIFTIRISQRAQFRVSFHQHISRARSLIMQLGAASAAWEFSYTGTLMALSILSTPEAVAVFSITRTLVRPISLLISTLMDVDFSRCSRSYSIRGRSGLSEVVISIWKAEVLSTSVPILALLLFPEFFLLLIYGEQYSGAGLELRLRVILFLPLIYVAPLELGLVVLRDTNFLIRAHLASLTISFVSLYTFYLAGHLNAATALGSLVLARIISMLLLHVRYFRRIAEPEEQPSMLSLTAGARDAL